MGKDLLFMPSVAAIIRNDLNEILFIRKKGESIWGLPAGAIEIGEAPAEAVIREVCEETGLIVVPDKIAGVFGGNKYRYEYSNGHKVEYLAIVFECRITEGLRGETDGEVAEFQFYKEDQIPEIAIPYPSEIFTRQKSEAAMFDFRK